MRIGSIVSIRQVLTWQPLALNHCTLVLVGSLLLLFMVSKGTAQITISGDLSCQECSSSLQGISVLAYPHDPPSSSLIAFSFTNRDGAFSMILNERYAANTIRLVFRSLTFAQIDTVLVLPQDIPSELQLSMTVSEEVGTLDEVVIQAARPLFEVRGDTVFFFIDPLRRDNDRNLNDLINRLPGLRIDSNTGRVQFQGRDVDYLLLDGENLTDEHYTDLGRILNPNDVDGLQLLTDFQQNQLLKGMEQGKLALNIQLKDAFLFKPKISLAGGGLAGERYIYRIQPELIALKQKHRWVLSSGFLNTGEDFSIFNPVGMEQILTEQNRLQGRSFLPLLPGLSDLPRSYYVDNRQFYTNLNHLYSRGRPLRIRTGIQADVQQGSMQREMVESYFNPDIPVNERRNETNYGFDRVRMQANTRADVEVSPTMRSETRLFGRWFRDKTDFGFINQPVSTGSDRSERLFSHWELTQNLTHRPSESRLNRLNVRLAHLSGDHHKKLNQTLLFLPDVDVDGNQEIAERSWYAHADIETRRIGWKQMQMNTFLQADIHRETLMQVNFDNPFLFGNLTTPDAPEQTTTFKDLLAGVRVSSSRRRVQWNLSPTIQVMHTGIADADASTGVAGGLEATLSFAQSSAASYSLSLKRAHEKPSDALYLGFPIIRNAQTIDVGDRSTSRIPVHSANLHIRYMGRESSDPAAMVMLNASRREKSLIVDQFFSPEYIVRTNMLENKPVFSSFLLSNLGQNFSAINAGYTVSITSFYHEFYLRQQGGDILSLITRSFKPEFRLFWQPGPTLGLESGATWGISFLTVRDEPGRQQEEGRYFASITINKGPFRFLTRYQYRRPDLSEDVHVKMLNMEAGYNSVRYPLQLRLVGQNLLNQQVFQRVSYTEWSTVSNRTQLMPVGGWVELTWIF